jgi:hypothetical protein
MVIVYLKTLGRDGKAVATIKRKTVEATVGSVQNLVRNELKRMLKSGELRFELDLDSNLGGDTLEATLDIYLDGNWIADTRSNIEIPRIECDCEC